ncbi:MAG: hypothetical protein ABI164_02825 [Acidobacteriaceae bacterium]
MFFRSAKSNLLNVFIWAISLSYGYSDWGIYREKFLVHPDGWRLYLSGGIDAPWQYRIGPWIVVDWMDRLFHWKPYDTLTLLDVLCLGFALWIMLQMLRNSHRYLALSPHMRWLPLTAALFVAEYYLVWGHWFQTSVTIPSILFVVLSMALMDGKAVRNRAASSVLLILLAGVQGLIRADVAVVLHAGFFLAVLFNRKNRVFLGRGQQAITSLIAATLAGCIQLYLMFVKFPHARYDAGGVFRLSTNLHPGMWLTMLLALLPFWLLLGVIAKKLYRPHGAEIMLITSAVLYLIVWAMVGLIDEVRIFLPFSFALIPATVMALTGLLPTESHSIQTEIPH